MADAERNEDVGAGQELRRLIEEATAQLKRALGNNFAGTVALASPDPAARQLEQVLNELLQTARQVEVSAEGIARDRDDLDHELAQVESRLAQEITERERTTRELRQQRSVLRSVIDAFPYCIFWKDREGVYLGANENKLRALGLQSVEQLIGKTDYDTAISKENAEFYRTVDKRVMDSNEPILNLEETQQRPDGPHVLLTTKVPLHDDAGSVTGILGMYVDVTERTRMDPSANDEKALQTMRSLLRLSGRSARFGATGAVRLSAPGPPREWCARCDPYTRPSGSSVATPKKTGMLADMAIQGYDGVKVFSATKAKDREVLGDRITTWIRANPATRIVDKIVSLSSDREFHCLSIVVFFAAELGGAELG
jgi:PAS domain S-box-containing protein